MLVEQDDWRRAAAARPAWREPSPEPPGAASVEEAPAPSVLSGGGSGGAGMGKGSLRKSTAESSLLSPSARSRVIFARKPASCVVPCGSLASSSKKK